MPATPFPRRRGRARRCAALALSLALALPPPAVLAQPALPALGEAASDDFSVSEEKALGEQIMRAVWADPAYLDDPLLLAYVQSLWTPLVEAGRRLGHIGADIDQAFAWQAFLVRDASVNAFALPGGQVGVFLGLIAVTRSRDELAAVLAHELTHISQRHIARSLGASQRAGMATMAAMLLALVVAARSGSHETAAAAISGGQAAMIQGQLNFSRDAEREADRIGFLVFDAAGYASAGMAGMFERLEQANRLNDTGAFPYLRSHPLTGERLSEARSRLTLGSRAGAGDASSVWAHEFMRTRAAVLMDTGVPALQAALVPPASSASEAARAAARAGAALAASLLGEHGRALAELEAAEAMAAGTTSLAPALQLLRAELLERAGRPAAALSLLAPELPAPYRRAGLLAHAQAAWALAGQQGPAAAAKPLRDAVEALMTWTALNPLDGLAWARLAQVAEAAGLPLRAARAQAEGYALKGQWQLAVDRLRAAQRDAGPLQPGTAGFIDAQVVDARLRALNARLIEERERERQAGQRSRR